MKCSVVDYEEEKKTIDEDRRSLIGGMRLLLNDAWSCLKCIRSDIKVIKCKEKTSYKKISFNLSTIFLQNYSKNECIRVIHLI